MVTPCRKTIRARSAGFKVVTNWRSQAAAKSPSSRAARSCWKAAARSTTAAPSLAPPSSLVAEDTVNVRAITIQLTDANGADIASRQAVHVTVLADANGDAFVSTGGSTGIAIGTDGALLAIVAKKLFLAISEADGDIDLTWTDTGTEAAYLAVILPNGKMVIGAAMTNT